MSICGKAGVWLDGLGLVGIGLESAGIGVVVDTDLVDAGSIFAKEVGSGLSSGLKTSFAGVGSAGAPCSRSGAVI